MSEEERRQMDEALVEKALETLYEHFDAVRIFITRDSEESTGITAANSWGKGPYYSQYGVVKEWVIREEALMRTAGYIEAEEED